MLLPTLPAGIEKRLDLPCILIECRNVTALKTITETPHRLPLKLSAVDPLQRIRYYP